MPNLPISQLPDSSRLSDNELFVIVQDGVTKKSNTTNVYDSLMFKNYVGSFYHTSSMLNGGINAINSMSLNTTDFARGMYINSSDKTKIVLENSGSYDIQFSAQVDRSAGSGQSYDVYVWLRSNGNDVPWSNTAATLPGGNGNRGIIAWNWFVSASAGDNYQIMWASAESNARIVHTTGNAVGPDIPSLIVTVGRVG